MIKQDYNKKLETNITFFHFSEIDFSLKLQEMIEKDDSKESLRMKVF
jgi:hypothetical protein